MMNWRGWTVIGVAVVALTIALSFFVVENVEPCTVEIGKNGTSVEGCR